ncbi:hypothetical protein G7046_g2149 [Stylonectria norvegica]|nr:hypothetical protein G7046_g2149 [Stylonectria norvegica]
MDMDTQADQPQGERSSSDAPVLRRSSRRTKVKITETSPVAQEPIAMSEPTRRNPTRTPKRKASDAAKQASNLPDNLLDEALAPLSANDIEEWEGWIELESEPVRTQNTPANLAASNSLQAFFNIILRDLGVENVKAQEIFSIDQASLDMLPHPVFGLIFLFQYLPGFDEADEDEDASDVWFANQTTNNACATVALLNIVMNADEIELGEKLREFKDSTKDLCTSLRGHQLSRNSFIRRIHNSFTRRMDHLNADLCLEHEASDAASQKAKKRSAPKKGRRPPKKRKVRADYGFHFIAYVPVGEDVWELDGLRRKPRKLDRVSSGDWTSIATPQIERRMLQYEESQLSFNLLALCQNPLAAHSLTIAHAAASLHYLHAQMKCSVDFENLIPAESEPLDINNESQLSEYNIAKSDVTEAKISESLQERISRPDFETKDAYELHQELVVEVKSAMGEYRAELMTIADDEQRVKGRKKDYGPALHKWVKKLAEKGVLEEIIKAA